MSRDPLQPKDSRPALLTPGPTRVPQAIRNVALKDPIYHRGQEYAELFLECRKGLAQLFQTKALPLILTSSGTGALESAVVNFTDEGDEVLIVKGGKFGERWQKLAEAYRCQPTIIDVDPGNAVDPDEVARQVKGNPKLKALFIQASETSSGAFHPIEEVCKQVKAINKELIIVVDAVSAVCAHDIKMDEWGIDIMASGSQKGFGVPPGLAFIAIDEALWQRQTQRSRFYFDLAREKKGQDEGKSAWTSATTITEQLHEALRYLVAAGPEELARIHKRLSDACRSSLSAGGIEIFAKQSPSHALTSFLPPYGLNATEISKKLREDYNFQIAGGQGDLKGKILRLAHLGFVNDFTLLESINALELALKDLYPQHQLGVMSSAALTYLHEH